MTSRGVTVDTGGLVAIERDDLHMRAVIGELLEEGLPIHVPAGVLAQAWRGGARQARLARFLRSTEVTIVALDETDARVVGAACAVTEHDDIVDVHVAVDARRWEHTVITSDPDDLSAIAPELPLIVV